MEIYVVMEENTHKNFCSKSVFFANKRAGALPANETINSDKRKTYSSKKYSAKSGPSAPLRSIAAMLPV